MEFFTIQLFFLFLLYPTFVISGDRSTYIVHMDKSLMPKAFADHNQWYTSIINSMKNSLIPESSSHQKHLSIHYTYDNVVHGFSALLSNKELKSLKQSHGFVSAYPDRGLKLLTTHTPEFLSLNPLTGLWPASNYGRDVIVGVIDTGIWPESRSFKDDGMTDIPKRWKGICQPGQDFNTSMCNKKLIGVRYFTNGVFAANPNINLSMKSGRDTISHGTLTSSIIAGSSVRGASYFGYANGTARGVAPSARVAMYKVFWEEEGSSSDFIAAMDEAIADGVDIISASLGDGTVPLYENPISIASFGAMKKGVLMSLAGGNEQDIGSLLNGYPWVLTVTAGSIDRFFTGKLTLGNGLTITGWTTFPSAATVNNLPLIYNKTLSSCNSTEILSTAKHGVIICESGNFFYQMRTITKSNVSAAIIISDDPRAIEYGDVFKCPSVLISSNYAQILIRYATQVHVNPPTATIEFQHTLIGTKPAPVVSYYTSRGPFKSYEGILKPDVMAPGTIVLTAWVPNKTVATIGTNISLTSDFAFVTGSSFACPHVSGIAALLKGAHPEWSPTAIRSAIMTTANPLDNTGKKIRDSLFNYEEATPLAMGSGHVNPNRALDPGLVYDASLQDYVDLVCSMNLTRAQTQTIVGANYKCSGSRYSSDLNYPSFMALFSLKQQFGALIKTFRRTVTYVGNVVPATYKFKLEEPKNTSISIWPQTLVFRKRNEKKRYFLTIVYSAHNDSSFARHGSLTWIAHCGKHTVRSPIVVCQEI